MGVSPAVIPDTESRCSYRRRDFKQNIHKRQAFYPADHHRKQDSKQKCTDSKGKRPAYSRRRNPSAKHLNIAMASDIRTNCQEHHCHRHGLDSPGRTAGRSADKHQDAGQYLRIICKPSLRNSRKSCCTGCHRLKKRSLKAFCYRHTAQSLRIVPFHSDKT